ncbi:MAG: SDR family oxidoreductase [Anaerofustis stercorihominis]|nr:SDR family oxidoreductase [Anaerofustis stercorihominis]
MNKTALVTGASGGLGLEFCKLLANDGYDVVLVARSTEKLTQLKNYLEETYSVNAYVITKDLSEENAAQQVFDETTRLGLNINILINNAGFGDYGHFVKSDWQKQKNMINLNIMSLAHLTYLYANEMVKCGFGRIMNLASVASFMPGPMMANYYATKAYVLSLTEALSVELKNTGVSICALCPGPTKTGFEEAAGAESADIFNDAYTMDAKTVAGYGYAKMLTGRTVIIPGLQNKLLTKTGRFIPRSLMRNAVYFIQKQRRG